MLTSQEISGLNKMPLSPHFTYYEAIKSDNHPKLVTNPPALIWNYIQDFAANVLEEFRLICCGSTPVGINSWYRNKDLNIAVGGVEKSTGGKHTSVHRILDETENHRFLGVAADVVPRRKSIYYAYRRIPLITAGSSLKTAIIYPKDGFIHLDSSTGRNEREYFISVGKRYIQISKAEALDIIGTVRTLLKLDIEDDDDPRSL